MSRIETQSSPLLTYGASPEEIAFSFLGNGASTPLLTSVQGCALIASLTHVSTGIIAVTMTVPINLVIIPDGNIDELASPDSSWVTVGDFANEGTSTPLTFQVSVWTPGATYAQKPLADPAVGRRVSVRLRVRRSAWGAMK